MDVNSIKKVKENELRKKTVVEEQGESLPARFVLTGFRATGKSVIGGKLAKRLGYDFIDTDEMLCARMGCSIADFVAQRGWPAFRELERTLLAELSARRGVVIATGGGAVQHHAEWRRLRDGALVVWLRADARTIRQRLRADRNSQEQRPSLTGVDPALEIDELLKEREPLYREGSDLTLDTVAHSPEELSRRIESLAAQNG